MKLDEIFLKKKMIYLWKTILHNKKNIIRQKKRFVCKAPITQEKLYMIFRIKCIDCLVIYFIGDVFSLIHYKRDKKKNQQKIDEKNNVISIDEVRRQKLIRV